MELSKTRLVLWTLLFAVYLIVRFAATGWLDSYGAYASYFFEAALVIAAVLLSGWRAFSRFGRFLPSSFAMAALLFAPLGFLTYEAAGWMHIMIPFDLSGSETIFLLLILAPTLEEAIFRFFAWEPFTWLGEKAALVGTTILFSYSHFHAYWFVPAEIHPFIYYQTAYTLLLGAACGFAVWKYRSLSGAVLIHFAFNAGFYLAFRF